MDSSLNEIEIVQYSFQLLLVLGADRGKGKPRLSSRQPMEAEAKPFPRDESTPPVTKMNLVSMQPPRD